MKIILIIDDDIFINNMLSGTLEAERYGILRTYSRTEVLMLISSQKADFVGV